MLENLPGEEGAKGKIFESLKAKTPSPRALEVLEGVQEKNEVKKEQIMRIKEEREQMKEDLQGSGTGTTAPQEKPIQRPVERIMEQKNQQETRPLNLFPKLDVQRVEAQAQPIRLNAPTFVAQKPDTQLQNPSMVQPSGN